MREQPSISIATEGDKEERHLLRTILDHSTAHLAYLDAEFTYVRVNPAYAQGVGCRIEELLGRTHFELFPHSEMRSLFQQVRDTGQAIRFPAMAISFPHQPKRGTTYWDWSLVPVKDESGRLTGLVISALEVTDRVRDQQELERLQRELRGQAETLEQMVARRTAALVASQERLRSIVEGAVIGIALLDRQGRLMAANPTLQKMLGYSEEELDGLALDGFGHPDDIGVNRDLFESLVAGELDYYQVEQRYLRNDGQVRWGELTVSRVKDTVEDRPWRAVAAIDDVTEKKGLQESLLRTERLAIAGRLGASLAHEINNPLQSVIGCLGLAEEVLDDRAEVRRYLEIALEELERAAGIVGQLRDLSRRTEAPKKEAADLNALVEKALMLTRKRCENQGVEVEWKPAQGMPRVPLVSDRMQQVFLNLVLNAVEAMPEGGRLSVSTNVTRGPAGARVCFVDTGTGISPDQLAQIFEPFLSGRPDGLGLGLTISKRIVEEHEGQIDVSSQPGKGTTFSVWLPG